VPYQINLALDLFKCVPGSYGLSVLSVAPIAENAGGEAAILTHVRGSDEAADSALA
jgi:hypothetical protein